ncbi:carboxymuconolactone decarboxylase family protein [Streptomyces sp. NPDC053048]|uniref:carboxymuconolactone decarboxylase family protein n=1 Tax=Streptomyces sp. NPDC053048 TaxID=3365694 RepID=UPI0037CEBD5E
MRTLARTALRGSLAGIRHVRAVPPGEAEGLVAAVYAQSEREFGLLAPPLALHSPAPEALAASWLLLRETLLAGDRVSRPAREAVATGVSRANSCPYCVEVHRAQVRTLPRDAAAGRLARWALRGGPRPFPAEDAPEILGVALAFHYLNRMVNVFLRETPVPPGTPAALRGGVLRVVTRLTRPSGPGAPEPGGSLGLLPDAPLPGDLSWAAGRPHIAGALARAAAAVDAGAERSVPEPVRELVRERLATGTGPPPPGQPWIDDTGKAVAALPAALRPAGRLALLTALASYRVGRNVVDDYRRSGTPGDRELIELTSWAALTAARRACSTDSSDPS